MSKHNIFEPIFYSWKGWIGYNAINLNDSLEIARALQVYFNLGDQEQLPPLEIDDFAVAKFHEILGLAEDEIFCDKWYEITMTMLTALTLWGNDTTNQVLEKKLANTILFKTFASEEIEDKKQRMLHYYLMVIANNNGISKGLEDIILSLISEHWQLETQNSVKVIELICYIVTRHYNETIMDKLLRLLKENQKKILTNEHKKQAVFINLFNSYIRYGKEEDIEYLFDFGKNLDKLWGNIYFVAQTMPGRAVLLYNVSRKYKEIHVNSGVYKIKGTVICDEIRKISEAYEHKKTMEAMDKEERHAELMKLGRSGNLLKIWSLLYKEGTEGSIPRVNEIKMLRMIKEIDEDLFKKALCVLNELSASVMLIDGIDKWLGFEIVEKQREVLVKKSGLDIPLVFEEDYWATPVQNACLELMDEVSNYLIKGYFPSRFLKYLRLMLTQRKHIFVDDDSIIFNVSDLDNYYCHPKDIYPIIIEILRMRLIFGSRT